MLLPRVYRTSALTFYQSGLKLTAMKEKAIFWHAPDLGGLELLKATYISHAFSRHTHPGFVIGMIERGIEVFDYRGETHFAAPGDVVVINPDMVHTGHSGEAQGWTYRMFYPSISMIRQVADAIGDRPGDMPFFKKAVIKDPDLAGQIRLLHQLLERSCCRLERATRFYDVMGQLILRHASNAPAEKKMGPERRAVQQAMALIDSDPADSISLESLSRQVGLSPFYLSRLFQRHTGLPPHAYRKQRRIQQARRLLKAQIPIAQVAAETGFADQSHLTRHFKQIVGVTPGQYATGLDLPTTS